MGSVKGWICVVLVGILGYLYMESFDPESIANARVLVTGASTGIGEEIAYHYAKAGAQLVITARREQALQKVKAKCLELGAKNVSLIIADMGEPVDREQILEKAVTVLGTSSSTVRTLERIMCSNSDAVCSISGSRYLCQFGRMVDVTGMHVV
ncbi:hydroxysteroid 11-beta-dehydrogenase 1 [Pelobates cultripes]|uniref:Hydroxysteroid 11-beta-dehydrogenase 1 n=1 Tax=Pelobates cultripes TaxID=61616 RepID=A0AAD1S8D9_PELCU|nr:hydroxysteroid 11-beta-dehydrogenase 1 [Pelobates cultripes]